MSVLVPEGVVELLANGCSCIVAKRPFVAASRSAAEEGLPRSGTREIRPDFAVGLANHVQQKIHLIH